MKPNQLLEIEPLISDRVRLAIVVTLAQADERVAFKTLLESLELSKGNLSSHLKKLEGAKLINVKKEFVNKKPLTTYTITKKGMSSLKKYLEEIESIIPNIK